MHYKIAKNILIYNNGLYGMNLYRGCSHGCIYCDSRSKCYNFSHDFEDIEVKINAPDLLENTLRHKRSKCMIGTGSMCDPYLHIEKNLKLTRRCLEIIDKYNFGVSILTKSSLVLRDLDILKSINAKSKCVVQMTLTTFDDDLCRIIEPNVSTTSERFKTLKILHKNNIPTIVWICPVLPYINDTEENLRGLLEYCFSANVKGIVNFGMGLTLRDGSRDYFFKKLDKHFPGLKTLYISRFGTSYICPSINEHRLLSIMHTLCNENNVMHSGEEIFKYINSYPQNSCESEQLSLFYHSIDENTEH